MEMLFAIDIDTALILGDVICDINLISGHHHIKLKLILEDGGQYIAANSQKS